MEKLSYYIFLIFINTFRIIPFRVIYVVSDFLFFVLYRVVGYRKKVVRQNMIYAFPAISDTELKLLEKRFYHYLADIFTESVKGISMNESQFLKRFKVTNPEYINSFYEKGQSVIVYASHYGNWEWGACMGLQYSYKQSFVFYKPLSNRSIDKYLRVARKKFGMSLVSMRKTARIFEQNIETPSVYFMVADQKPHNLNRAHEVEFLSRQTLFIHGPAKYAKQYNYPVIYGDVRQVKRGYYTITFKPVTEAPEHLSEEKITANAVKELENVLLHDASKWLWSHRRWKYLMK
ncbi:MAG: lysophospholipid acyltransferase family protein [Bacteroidota bacterium]|nr:lysophospholipid acyltransferase family protein [Bacteroidota bacterium]